MSPLASREIAHHDDRPQLASPCQSIKVNPCPHVDLCPNGRVDMHLIAEATKPPRLWLPLSFQPRFRSRMLPAGRIFGTRPRYCHKVMQSENGTCPFAMTAFPLLCSILKLDSLERQFTHALRRSDLAPLTQPVFLMSSRGYH